MGNLYNIAGHLVCIECDNSAVMDTLDGFKVFQIPLVGEADVYIVLKDAKPLPIYGTLYHTIVTDVAISRFYYTEESFYMGIWRQNELRLSMQFEKNSKKCHIQGELSPVLLRFALWISFNLATIDTMTVAIHASAVIYKKQAFLFLGESGTGKSTHTRLICQRYPEAELLNDDSPILRVENGECMVYGSPWSGKTACYKPIKFPLGGVTRLHQAVVNKISLLPLHNAIGALLPSLPPELYLCPNWQSKVISILSEMIEQVSVFSLECIPSESAAELSLKTMTRTIRKWNK